MTTRAGLLSTWASFLAAILLSAAAFAMAFSAGAGAQEVGCKGQVVLDPGHGGAIPAR